MKITAAELAHKINATIEGDPEVVITTPAKIEEAGPGSITFLANPAYEHFLYGSEATAVLVSRDFQPKSPVAATMLRVDNVYETVSQLLALYQQDEATKTRRAISANAAIDETSSLGANVRIGKFSVVEAGASIGDDTVVLDQVYIGPQVRIGKRCTIYPGVRILRDCVIGDDCVLHANVVVGGDGFGFVPDENNHYKKVPQIGKVIIEDRVEIGAGTTIDRATMGATIIRSGVKLDNLIQIAHNVEIGQNTVIAAQVGVAGSSKIGANCRIGGQAGIAGHVKIADGTQIQAQSGVGSNITDASAQLGGTPAFKFSDYMRSYAVFKQLPELNRLIPRMKKQLEELSKKDQLS
ncbi:UDP-3-O-(3-hydroxymyristoyl)glucosamine N-acyltransferase [Lewinella sp. W8]|uniref:UDP-3-O-(3-hydroxymyristoyl)glucosamine N-acyltransferase n=1 Tax=Lewinella sp. W8 TaxID=2528208 RepID=UPI0010682489|nr:UDP-3-O-(3-hydroxymyristoyl)glucosamine N-acyltransferase [Lewinella sp. W8]MTB50839.1 UDP-3-O-(3-hydroxymyristoyl)glucosamine N-acyltransferase [Lewinella sp. W8]